jgi:very-short-patch-repair endonuclease
MSVIQTINSKKIIPVDIFKICLIDLKSIKEICKIYPKRKDGAYLLNKFNSYLRDKHKISIKEYVKNYLHEKWPLCPISNEEVGYQIRGIGLIFSIFKQGKISKEHSLAFKKGCEKLSKDRTGNKNPMYGKKAWNTGLKKETDERIAIVAKKRIGKKMSQDSKNKMKEAREKHPLKARHITKHSDESKEKMRKATSKRWENGDFSFKKTSIEKKVELWLLENNFNFQYQVSINGFVADFACLENKTVIECQGDFFHCNPKIDKYKIPKYAVQKRNVYRDCIKKEVYIKNGWQLIELWESDINSEEFKNILECELKK